MSSAQWSWVRLPTFVDIVRSRSSEPGAWLCAVCVGLRHIAAFAGGPAALPAAPAELSENRTRVSLRCLASRTPPCVDDVPHVHGDGHAAGGRRVQQLRQRVRDV